MIYLFHSDKHAQQKRRREAYRVQPDRNAGQPRRQIEGAEQGTPYSEHDAAALRIDAIRRDEVPGIHTVCYDSEADCIEISHSAHSRKGFALGAVLAAEFTADHSGLLTISDMFDF